MVVVADIVEVHQGHDEMVLQPITLDDSAVGEQGGSVLCSEVLDQDVLLNWLQPDSDDVEIEVVEAGRDFALRNDDDPGYVDRKLLVQLDRLLDDLRIIRLLREPFERGL